MGVLFAIIGSVLAIAAAYGQYQTATKANEINESVATTQNKLAEETFEYNKEKDAELFEYNKWLNQMQMEREDTAVQRRVADLKAAGMNPLLAAGDAATSGAGGALSRNQLSAPDLQGVDFQNPFAGMSGLVNNAYQSTLQGYNTYLDTKKANADISLIQSQIDKNNADLFAKNMSNGFLEQQLYDNQVNNYLQIQSRQYDIEMQLKKLEGQESSNEYQKLKNEHQTLENIAQKYQNLIIEHDWNIYKNYQLPTSVVDKGAQTTIGQAAQDAMLTVPALTTGNNETRNPNGVMFEAPTVPNQSVKEDGSIVSGEYIKDGKVSGTNIEAGSGYMIKPDNTLWYGGYQVKSDHINDVVKALNSGQKYIPIKWLITTRAK